MAGNSQAMLRRAQGLAESLLEQFGRGGQQPSSATLLAHLRSMDSDPGSEVGARPRTHTSGSAVPSWPCAQPDAAAELRHRPRSGLAQRWQRAAMWSVAVGLRGCGLGSRWGSLVGAWPADEGGWLALQSSVADAAGFLADVRSDNASLVCARGGGPRPLASELAASALDALEVNMTQEKGGDDVDDEAAQAASPRCPRCGRAAADDPEAQGRLAELRVLLGQRHGDEDAELASSALRFSAQAAADWLEAPLAASAASCPMASSSARSRLAAAWDGGGLNALVTAAESLECGACDLAGAAAYLAEQAGAADADGQPTVWTAVSSLLVTRCWQAVDLSQLLAAWRSLELAVWRGLGHPLLAEVASQHMVRLLRSGRSGRLVSAELAAGLCGAPAALRGLVGELGQLPAGPEAEALKAGAAGDPLRASLLYLNLASAAPSAAEVASGLAHAGLWLRQGLEATGDVHEAVSKALSVVRAAHYIAMSMLTLGQQYIVLTVCASALRPVAGVATHDGGLESAVKHRLAWLARQIPFWQPPLVPAARVQQIGAIASRLRAAFVARLRALDPVELNTVPGVAQAAALGLYEASVMDGSLREAEQRHPGALGAALGEAGVAAQSLQEDPWAALPQPAAPRQTRFAALRGLKVDLATGFAEVLLERPRPGQGAGRGHISPALLADALAIGGGPLSLRLVPSEAAAPPSSWLRPGLLQRAVVAPAAAADSALKGQLLHAALLLRSLASQEAQLEPGPAMGGAELRLRCVDNAYSVHRQPHGLPLEVRLGPPRLEVAPLGQEFDSAAVGRLAAAVTEQLGRAGGELVAQLCSARAAQTLLAKDPEQLAAVAVGAGQEVRPTAAQEGSSAAPRSAVQAGAGLLHVASHPRRAAWLERLADVHASIFRDMGFVHLDSAGCWDESHTFGRCCSVGEHAEGCWQRGFTQERCCRSLSVSDLDGASAEDVVAALLRPLCDQLPALDGVAPAVVAWLRDPTGSLDGRTLSGILADALDDAAQACTGGVRHQGPPEDDGGQSPDVRPRLDEVPVAWVSGPLLPQPWQPSVVLEPVPRPEEVAPGAGGDTAWPELGDGVEALTLQELERRAQQERAQSREVLELVGAAPEVRSLRSLGEELHRHLERLGRARARRHRAAERARASGGEPGMRNPDSAGRQASGAAGGRGCHDMDGLHAGQVLHIRAEGTQGAFAEEAEVLNILEAAGESRIDGHLHRLRLLRSGATSVYNLSDPRWSVARLGTQEDGTICQGLQTTAKAEPGARWPDCIEQGQSLPGADGAGVFVNVAAFGATSGCFREDCRHSDHFDSDSPAHCARTCGLVRACRWWSFWSSRMGGGTCWLRRHAEQRVKMASSVLGPSSCIPPAVSSWGRAAPGTGARRGDGNADAHEPTLFDLVGGRRGLGPSHPYHQWDLVKVLEAFGHLTPSQVEAKEPSRLRASALRFARRAQRS
ncbi:unnamed protein product [Prorocentrum cordatum]|uniref:Uncharacterized protein n=1 Tax=Prorocentrum cordatum TaxID=2364126 RepID=A0ABN9PAB5_9DINO|nr:unnamed protein product [Polarella glacialis]